MEVDATSYGTDIQKYQDALAKDPGSYCFAPLAELYRKVGLLDEAIKTAKVGCELHPGYVGGLMALGRASFEKGMREESRAALENVLAITPDNLLALKLLGRVYMDESKISAAAEMFRRVLSQDPGDTESQALLAGLSPGGEGEPAFMNEWGKGFSDQDNGDLDMSLIEEEYGVEDADVIEDLTEEVINDDLFDLDEKPAQEQEFRPADEEEDVAGGGANLISTVTMAELYASQGFFKRALTIYRQMLESDPDNAAWKKRLYDLKQAIDEDTAMARGGGAVPHEAVLEITGIPDEKAGPTEAPTLEPADDSDRVIQELEKWLGSIRRRQ